MFRNCGSLEIINRAAELCMVRPASRQAMMVMSGLCLIYHISLPPGSLPASLSLSLSLSLSISGIIGVVPS